MSEEIAALLRAVVLGHHSFLVMAVPRLAGKSTVLQAVLAARPPGMPVSSLASDGRDLPELIAAARGGYLVVPEIARGPWAPGYVWGAPVRAAFRGLATGEVALATALHAPDVERAFDVICGENGVPDDDAARLAVVVYLRSLGDEAAPTRRVVATLHEIRSVRGGRPDARLLFRWDERADRFERAERPERVPFSGAASAR